MSNAPAGQITTPTRQGTPIGPGLVVENGTLDFGCTWEQPAYRHVFATTNPTGSAILVAEFNAGCGCKELMQANQQNACCAGCTEVV